MDYSTKLALEFINRTNRHVFLTGKAGSGKTTFLKSLKNNTDKKIAIAAPTGIAAVNAEGVTLHSLFQLPIEVYLPGKTQLSINLTSDKRVLLRQLELLVIDEVSMLRADVLDSIDNIMRSVRKNSELPFGGIQVLYIGDLHQLSPVAKDEELEQLKVYYKSLYFISAKVFELTRPVCISLQTIYRQTDPKFVSVLNNIRNGTVTRQDIDFLNSCYRPDITAINGYVTLVTHNQSADKINSEKLSTIPSDTVGIEAEITGEFEESMFPTDKNLQLRIGAQVMLLKNDRGSSKKYFNGKMGLVQDIQQDKLAIGFGQDESIEIQKEVWNNTRYSFDEKSGLLLQNTIGSFTQFPVRLAWAITIHKSQGLTFDRAVLDVKKIFAPGQAYVAFSRIRSVEGLVLKEPVQIELINKNAISPDYIQLPDDVLKGILETEKINFLEKTVNLKLDWGSIVDFVSITDQEIINQVGTSLKNSILGFHTTSGKFAAELRGLVQGQENDYIIKINDRIHSACYYFLREIAEMLEKILVPAYANSKDSIAQKLQHKFAKNLIAMMRLKKKDIEHLLAFSGKGKIVVPRDSVVVKKAKVKSPDMETPSELILSLFNEGLPIQEIAQRLKLNIPSVENYLASYITSGKVKIQQIVGDDKLNQINLTGELSPLSLKIQFGNTLTFGQIKALINHFKL